jgi:hypothetical protein
MSLSPYLTIDRELVEGELVQLFMYSPHDSELACTPFYTGIFLDYDDEGYVHGWILLVDGERKTFTKQHWRIKKMDKNYYE